MSNSAGEILTRNSSMDAEHRVQVRLIEVLCKAVDDGKPNDEVTDLLQQLIDYSKAHFMSEELLMRLDSYEGFDEHVEDHAQMLETLDALAHGQASGATRLMAGQVKDLLAFLLRHIETRDARYANSVKI